MTLACFICTQNLVFSPEVLPYRSYIGMFRPIEWGQVLHRFGLKTGIHFAYFGLELGVLFEETTGVYKGI